MRAKAEATLTKAGYRVRCETSPAAALAILEKEKIFAGTTINCPHASTKMRTDRSRCRIQEIKKAEEGISIHEVDILDWQ